MASRGVLSHRHVTPNRSRRTASRRGRSPEPLVQRADGFRYSRPHSDVCSHTPTSAGQCGLPRRAGRSWFPIWADAVSTGCARRGWPDRRNGGRVAGRCAGRLVRAAHGGHPEFPGSAGRPARDRVRRGPAAGTGGRVVRRATGGRPSSLGACDPCSATCRPASGTKAVRLPRRGGGKEGGSSGCVSNSRGRAAAGWGSGHL